MDFLPVKDVRAIVHLLGEVAVLETDLPGKRRFLMNELAELLKADYWIWVHFRDQAQGNPPMSFMQVLGGWDSQSQMMKFAEGVTSPAAITFNARMRIGSGIHRTRRRSDMFSDAEWTSMELVQSCFQPIGVGEFLHSSYPLGENTFSSMAFLRRLGSPDFSPRDVCIAHIITNEIDWLHRQGTDVPAAEHINDLSPRQRQVMIRLLSGDGVKQIARKLALSTHTVNDHIKGIYRHFGVGNRGELLAQFLAGGITAQRDE